MWCFNREIDSDKINEETIIWKGPYSWPKYENDDKQKKMINTEGVYLWTFKYKNGFLIYSAGVTNSTKRRFTTHTREYKKGNYTILDIDAIQKEQRKEIWHGWQYAKANQDEFKNRKEIILNAVNEQLKAFQIFIAEVSDKRKRERIEAEIMYSIYQSKENWSEIADRGMHLKNRYNYEMPVKIKNQSEYKIYGLKEYLEI